MMRTFVLMVLFGAVVVAHADLSICPDTVLKDAKSARALAFLQSIAGTFQLGRCSIELHVCQGVASEGDGDTVVGDLLVHGPGGQSAYVLFDFSAQASGLAHRLILNGRRMVHYESIEHVRDDINGRTENYRLEILKTPDLQRLESLDLGVYTSTEGHSIWINCGD